MRSGIKNETEVTLNLSWNLIGSSNDEINFPHKKLLSETQVSKICNGFTNGSSVHLKFSKTQLSKMIESGGFITRGLPIFVNVLWSVAEKGQI